MKQGVLVPFGAVVNQYIIGHVGVLAMRIAESCECMELRYKVSCMSSKVGANVQ